MPEEWMAKQEEWFHRNPLRHFRTSRGLTYFKTASFLGVSVTAIQQWEIGSNKPNDENMEKLATLTGNADIAQEWAQWLEERPGVTN